MKEYISVALAVDVTVGAPPLHLRVNPKKFQSTVHPPILFCVTVNIKELTPGGIFWIKNPPPIGILFTKVMLNTVP